MYTQDLWTLTRSAILKLKFIKVCFENFFLSCFIVSDIVWPHKQIFFFQFFFCFRNKSEKSSKLFEFNICNLDCVSASQTFRASLFLLKQASPPWPPSIHVAAFSRGGNMGGCLHLGWPPTSTSRAATYILGRSCSNIDLLYKWFIGF